MFNWYSMSIIRMETMKIIDKLERCDRRCVVMGWSNSKVKKKNARKQNKKTEKNKGLTQARVKVWEINYFAVCLK